jgi:hypothetical protein
MLPLHAGRPVYTRHNIPTRTEFRRILLQKDRKVNHGPPAASANLQLVCIASQNKQQVADNGQS